jgi:hypothetical protein
LPLYYQNFANLVADFTRLPKGEPPGTEVTKGSYVTVTEMKNDANESKYTLTRNTIDNNNPAPAWYDPESINIENKTSGQPVLYALSEDGSYVKKYGPFLWVPGVGRIKPPARHNVNAWFETDQAEDTEGFSTQDFSEVTDLAFKLDSVLTIDYKEKTAVEHHAAELGWSGQAQAILDQDFKSSVHLQGVDAT